MCESQYQVWLFWKRGNKKGYLQQITSYGPTHFWNASLVTSFIEIFLTLTKFLFLFKFYKLSKIIDFENCHLNAFDVLKKFLTALQNSLVLLSLSHSRFTFWKCFPVQILLNLVMLTVDSKTQLVVITSVINNWHFFTWIHWITNFTKCCSRERFHFAF